jgi:spore maturation protein A
VAELLGKTFSLMCIISFFSALYTGNMQALSDAVIDGATRAVSLTVSLLGVTCLWCGVMRLFTYAKIIEKLSRLLRPLLKLVFPNAAKSGNGIEEIVANVSANLLGIGNAATPLALSALEKLQAENENKDEATEDMITLAVLNSSSLSLVPTTILTMRRLYGSVNSFSVILPIWIVSSVCSVSAIFICRLFALIKSKTKKRRTL